MALNQDYVSEWNDMFTLGMVVQLADLFLLACEADFHQVLLKNKDRKNSSDL
jgi:hypothetical protein